MGNLYISLYESVLYLCRAWLAVLCAGEGGADGADAGGHARGHQQFLQEGQVQARPLTGQLYSFFSGRGARDELQFLIEGLRRISFRKLIAMLLPTAHTARAVASLLQRSKIGISRKRRIERFTSLGLALGVSYWYWLGGKDVRGAVAKV